MNITPLSRIIVEFYEKLSRMRGNGLTTAQAHTIEIVGHEGSVKMKDLTQKISVATGTVTVDRLEKACWCASPTKATEDPTSLN